MEADGRARRPSLAIGIDMGTFETKAVLVDGETMSTASVPTTGRPADQARQCLLRLLPQLPAQFHLGITGAHAHLLAGPLGIRPSLEAASLHAGLVKAGIDCDSMLSLGHENIYYLELGSDGGVEFINRNGQCAAGSGAFWYQQAVRLGHTDRELSDLALEADAPVRISGRCAVFAKSDMTHAINEGATVGAVAAGLARTLADMICVSVARGRLTDRHKVVVVGGVADNEAVLTYLRGYLKEGAELIIPPDHRFLAALGAAVDGTHVSRQAVLDALQSREYVPERPLSRLDPEQVDYAPDLIPDADYDPSRVFLGVDCGSVSTKCVLLDSDGRFIGGVYLPTSGRPALRVLELVAEVRARYGHRLANSEFWVAATGSGRFLTQKILSAQYAVDEITCQATGVRSLFRDDQTLSVIEIGGEDSKFMLIENGALSDYNMNPVCAAGTGTFLESLASLLGIDIAHGFSEAAFAADYAIDLGDTCTLLSQSTLAATAALGLPFSSQIASLAWSSARNYLAKTAEQRSLLGRVVFTGATARNRALAAAFAGELRQRIAVPPSPELTGALGAALMARTLCQRGEPGDYQFGGLDRLTGFSREKRQCQADCEHEHHCMLDVIRFSDGKTFLYGDRCGRYSDLHSCAALSAEGPDLCSMRNDLWLQAAGQPLSEGPTVGIPLGGLFWDQYPFWAAFFRELGARVVLSGPTTGDTATLGKQALTTEMCYPVEVLVGHYRQLVESDTRFVFVPDVVDAEPLPWAGDWPRGFVCPLLQTLYGTVSRSLDIAPERLLTAQINFRQGMRAVQSQLMGIAAQVLGRRPSSETVRRAVSDGYRARDGYERDMELAAVDVMSGLEGEDGRVVAVFLGRPYTLYDEEVSKRSLKHARERGLVAVPMDWLLAWVRGWYEGRHEQVPGSREEFAREFSEFAARAHNIYSFQMQRMLSAAFMVRYLNDRSASHRLPRLSVILHDPFRCGPNAMLRHFLGEVVPALRLTMDEHTAPAGMITRLEAFRNTCLARDGERKPSLRSGATMPVREARQRRILVPEPSPHARVFVSMLRNYGVDSDLLPRSHDRDLTLARRYANGDECLPLLQNVQDFLEYAQGAEDLSRTVFFQGWACGPCRYGMYAPVQALLLNRAGLGERMIYAARLADAVSEFGLGFAIGLFAGTVAVDVLDKWLRHTRPYELAPGTSDMLMSRHLDEISLRLERFRPTTAAILAGTHLGGLCQALRAAAADFAAVPRRNEQRPRIAVAGEFYVRLDDRCNREIVRRIEQAGGEVSLSPAGELFTYTGFINEREHRTYLHRSRNLRLLLPMLGYRALNSLAHRDEALLVKAGGDIEPEPSPQEICSQAAGYVSSHYGGEPPMTIGRTAAVAARGLVDGALFVEPFTCLPGSIVAVQASSLRRDLDLPIACVSYDGRASSGRDELIDSLVFQAAQRRARRR